MMAIVELVIATGALVLSALELAAVLDVRGVAARALAVLVLGAAIVVGLIEALSLLYLLTPAALTVGQLVVLAATSLVWLAIGRPSLLVAPAPRSWSWRTGLRRHPALAVLAGAVALALALQAFMALTVAPNESDALGYHLPRAAYWLQHHSAVQYQPGQLDDPQLVAPPNAEMLMAWTMGLARSDRLTQLVQWLAMVAVMLAVYVLARQAGFRRSECAWAAGLFALMPEPLLQSATDQNDLVLTALLVAGGLFLVRGLRDRHLGELSVSAAAIGLAVGTKLSFALAIPAFLMIAAVALQAHRPPRAFVARATGILVMMVIALGAFNYVQNEIYTNNVTGFSGTPTGDFVKTNPLADAGRVAWNLVDAPGLPQPGLLRRAANDIARPLFRGVRGSSFRTPDPPIRTESNEDESAYGLLGLLVLVPLLLVVAVAPRSAPMRRLLALSAVMFFVVYVLVLGYTPEAARYLMPAVAVGAPLLALTARRSWTAWPVLALALLTLPGAVLKDNNKLILTGPGDVSILSQDRLAQQTLDQDLTSFAPVVARVDRLAGAHGSVGFLNQDNLRDYLLIGEPLQRRAVGLDPPDLTVAGIRSAHVVGVVAGYLDQPPCRTPTCVPLGRGLRSTRIGADSVWITLSP
jgi:Dolichyl-phosphate-mannose-protein mannosyltransferase